MRIVWLNFRQLIFLLDLFQKSRSSFYYLTLRAFETVLLKEVYY